MNVKTMDQASREVEYQYRGTFNNLSDRYSVIQKRSMEGSGYACGTIRISRLQIEEVGGSCRTTLPETLVYDTFNQKWDA